MCDKYVKHTHMDDFFGILIVAGIQVAIMISLGLILIDWMMIP